MNVTQSALQNMEHAILGLCAVTAFKLITKAVTIKCTDVY